MFFLKNPSLVYLISFFHMRYFKGIIQMIIKTIWFWLQLLKNKLSTVVYLGPCYSPGLRLLLTATATVPATAAATALPPPWLRLLLPPLLRLVFPPPLLRLLLPPC